MTTAEVAGKLVVLCREGKDMKVIEPHCGDQFVSREIAVFPNEINEGIKAVCQNI